MIILASFKRMYEQKFKERQRNYELQQKQLAALKKSGKSGKQAVEEMKNRITAKEKKGGAGKKKGNTHDEGIFL